MPRNKKKCIRGKECPYQDEPQHSSEYSHSYSPPPPKRRSRNKGRKLGAKTSSPRGLLASKSKWTCNQCTFLNSSNLTKCAMCNEQMMMKKRKKRIRTSDSSNDVIDLCESSDDDERFTKRKRRRRNRTVPPHNETSNDRKLKADQDDAFELSRAIDLSIAQKKAADKRAEERRKKDKETKKKGKLKVVGEEPTKGDDLVTIMFKLPDNSRIQRKFKRNDEIRKMYYFLDLVLEEKGVVSYSTKIPPEKPVDRDEENLDLTFEDKGFVGRIAVFVIDLNR